MIAAWRRLLWRFRLGGCEAGSLAAAMEAEINAQVNDREGLREYDVDALRRWGAKPLAAVDETLVEAVRKIRRHEFESAAGELRHGAALLSTLRSLAAAMEALESSRAQKRRLIERFGLDPFLNLPLMRILERLMKRIVTLMAEEEFHKALFIAELVQRMVTRFEVRRPERAPHLLRRLERIGHEVPAADQPEMAAAGLVVLRRLAEDGYTDLAERLTEELEVEFLGWRTLRLRDGSGAAARIEQVTRDLEAVAQRAHQLDTRLSQWITRRVRQVS